MADRLVYVNKTVSDGTATALTVTGINTDDVYLLVLKLIQTQNNNETINLRVTKSGSTITNNYHRAFKILSSAGLSAGNYAGGSAARIMENVDDANGGGQAIIHLLNFNSSSLYSSFTTETVCTVSNQSAGMAGGGVHKVSSASDGVTILGASGGTFINGASAILYRVT